MQEELEVEHPSSSRTVTVDKDKLERLALHEDAVLHNEEDVAEKPKTSFRSFLNNLFATGLVNPTEAVITDVDVDRSSTPDEITIFYKVKDTGDIESRTFSSTDDEYGRLLGYLDLAPHDIFGLLDETVPIRHTPIEGKHRNDYEFDLPRNTSQWATKIFSCYRMAYKFKFLEGDSTLTTKYNITGRGVSFLSVFQFLFVSLMVLPFPEEPTWLGITFYLIFVCSVIVLISGLYTSLITRGPSLNDRFDSLKESGWPVD